MHHTHILENIPKKDRATARIVTQLIGSLCTSGILLIIQHLEYSLSQIYFFLTLSCLLMCQNKYETKQDSLARHE